MDDVIDFTWWTLKSVFLLFLSSARDLFYMHPGCLHHGTHLELAINWTNWWLSLLPEDGFLATKILSQVWKWTDIDKWFLQVVKEQGLDCNQDVLDEVLTSVKSVGMFQNSDLHDMTSIADAMSTLDPIRVAQTGLLSLLLIGITPSPPTSDSCTIEALLSQGSIEITCLIADISWVNAYSRQTEFSHSKFIFS